MLGKLLKYEFKATARIFLLMYAALLVVAGISAIIIPFNGRTTLSFLEAIPTLHTIITSLTTLLYVLVAIAVIVVTFVIIIVRFYRMLGDEGYLWFTLPVTANQQILSKLIAAFVWSLASMIMVVISIGLLTLPSGWMSELWRISVLWNELVQAGFAPGVWLWCGVVLLLVAWLSSTLVFYTAIATGPNLVKSRLGGSVLAYIIIYIATQILGMIVMLVFAGPFASKIEAISSLSKPLVMSYGETASMLLGQMSDAVNQLVLLCTGCFGGMCLVLAVVFYFITRHFITNKLNLA